MGRRRYKKPPEGTFLAQIHALSHDGRGIATVNEKTTFIPNTLPGEEVEFRYTFTKSNLAEGEVISITKPSPNRITPNCQYFERCGGCALQHLSTQQQLAHKQQTLLDQLQHFGKVTPEQVISPITGDTWGYRNKARLGVRNIPKKGATLVGFREKQTNFITEIERCEVLNPQIGHSIMPLRELITTLSIPDQIPQIEVAIGEEKVALIFRHLKPFNSEDLKALHQFGQQHNFAIYLQPKGPDTIHLLDDDSQCPLLSYQLPNHKLTLQFHPSDFTQVNQSINQQLIDLVIELLDLNDNDHVLDLFCGLGNFTLPMATRTKWVTGVEGSTTMTQRAAQNATLNKISNVEFYACDLSQPDWVKQEWAKQNYNKLLLDPPRSGALEVVRCMAQFDSIKQLVYVSCNPATLAHDIGVLVNEQGFQLQQAGILDMFPHTSHVESIALLQR